MIQYFTVFFVDPVLAIIRPKKFDYYGRTQIMSNLVFVLKIVNRDLIIRLHLKHHFFIILSKLNDPIYFNAQLKTIYNNNNFFKKIKVTD